MVKKRRVHIFLIIILCVLIVPIGLLGCRGKEQKTVTAADQFLLAIVNDTAPKKERFQVLTYVAIDSEKGLFAITVPEETKIEMPGVGYNRIKHALNFKDLSLTSRSIAKFVGSSEEQGHYIAIDAKYIATIVDDAGGLYIKRSDSTLGGDAALEALYWAAKEGKPEMQHAIVSAILERLVSANEFPGVAGALKKGGAQGEVNTNLDGEEFKKTMSSLGGLEEVTVVLLPGLVNEDDGIYYWVPRVAVLNDLRRKVTKEGLSAGIG
ncbi:MAG TPA: hypothetical protein VE439_00915, partial [Anaerolineae bacterium]|nr:hypothetical protein [Anaerolineae bacterium]